GSLRMGVHRRLAFPSAAPRSRRSIMPAPLMSREEVVARLLEVFRRDGYDGASLTELSKRAGLGKSSLYHHFPGGKVDMALAVLEVAGGWIEAHVAGAVRGRGAPEERLDRVLEAIGGFYQGGTKA